MRKKPTSRSSSDPSLQAVAAWLKLLGEPERLKIVLAVENAERTVAEIVRRTGLSRRKARRHLQVLTRAGVLSQRDQGASSEYSLADRSVTELYELAGQSVQRKLSEHAKVIVELAEQL